MMMLAKKKNRPSIRSGKTFESFDTLADTLKVILCIWQVEPIWFLKFEFNGGNPKIVLCTPVLACNSKVELLKFWGFPVGNNATRIG